MLELSLAKLISPVLQIRTFVRIQTRFLMDTKILIILGTALLSVTTGFAQHTHTATKPAAASPFTFQTVLSQALSEPELKEYTLNSSVMTITAGGEDTVAHRHDCELFGYVLIGLDHKSPQSFNAGQMFYENRNIPHTLGKNASNQQIAKVLLLFIIKNGRQSYTRLYPDKR